MLVTGLRDGSNPVGWQRGRLQSLELTPTRTWLAENQSRATKGKDCPYPWRKQQELSVSLQFLPIREQRHRTQVNNLYPFPPARAAINSYAELNRENTGVDD